MLWNKCFVVVIILLFIIDIECKKARDVNDLVEIIKGPKPSESLLVKMIKKFRLKKSRQHRIGKQMIRMPTTCPKGTKAVGRRCRKIY